MPRFTHGAKLLLIFVPVSLIVVLTVTAFLAQIGKFPSGAQENYVIDGYYYAYLGQRAVATSSADHISIYAAAEELRPNVSSTGIVYLNALLASAFSSIYEIAIFLVLSYWAVLFLLLRTERVNSAIIFLPFCGLMPYLFVPTKEAFLILGILLGVLAYLDRRFIAFGLLGVVLIYLARPQAFYIGLLAIFLCYLSKYRKAFACVLIIALAVYWYRLRDGILVVAEFEQHLALMADNGFCHVGPLPVCVDSSGKLEFIFAVRLLTLLGLPLKWAWQGIAVLWEGLPLSTAIIRVALVVQFAWAYVVFSRLGSVDRRAVTVRRGMAYFAGIYFITYGILVYFQSTRQLAVATTILLIGFCVTSARHEYAASQAHYSLLVAPRKPSSSSVQIR